MRFFELSSGFRIPVDAEEQAILDQAIAKRQLDPAALDERAQEVARKMVSRGLLLRRKAAKGFCYEPNSAVDLWRY